MFKGRILRRLIIIFFTLIACCLSVFALYMLDVFNQYSMDNMRDNIVRITKNTQLLIDSRPDKDVVDQAHFQSLIKDIADVNSVKIYLLDDKEQILAESDDISGDFEMLMSIDRKILQREKVITFTRKNMSNNANYIIAATLLGGKSNGQLLLVSSSIQGMYGNYIYVQKLTLAALLGAYILAFFLCVYVARKVMEPLYELTAAAEEFAGGKLERRINIKTEDEFAVLAYTLNNLAGSLTSKITEIDMEKRKLELILEQMDNAVMLIDNKGNIQTVNKRAQDIFSINMACSDTNLCSLDVLHSTKFEVLLKETIAKGLCSTIDLKLKVKDVPKSFRVYTTPITVAYTSSPKYVLCVFYDITALMNIYDKQVEFVANASHELSTPLTSIRGFAESLEDVSDNPELVVKFSKIIQDESLRMQRLIGDLLKLAKLDSVEYSNAITLGDISVEGLLESICTELGGQAAAKNIVLDYTNKDENCKLYSNYDWLKQALVNLVENAIKYAPCGARVSLVRESSNDGMRFIVKDTGNGISESELKKIFERFYRLDSDRNRKSGGTGLGLAIVRFIVKILGGKIEVESHLGQGTVFTITVPFK